MANRVSEFVLDLHLPLSRIRLESYRSLSKAPDDLEIITNYFWNVDLCEALVPSLHAVELAVRNSVHAALSQQYGTDMWFYKPGLLGYGQVAMLASALEKLSRSKKEATGDAIVASVTFGFWVALLSAPYERTLWQPNGYALLRRVFPHATALSRKDAHTRLNGIRQLRNRVFHHEEVWDWSSLRQEHRQIHETIGWISPSLHRAVHAVDEFPTALDGREAVRRGLIRHLALSSSIRPVPRVPRKGRTAPARATRRGSLPDRSAGA